MTQNTRIVLASRPSGLPKSENFRLERIQLAGLQPGQVLLKILYLSLDPYMRGRMSDRKSYAAPVPVDGVMEGGTVAEVLESQNPDFKAGDVVLSHSGWQTHAISNGKDLLKLVDWPAPLSTALGVMGMPGFTAYVGLANIGKLLPGETLVVAAATGAVGSVVGQIAKIKSARAVGIAGGANKCALLKSEFGFDEAVDHSSPTFAVDLAKACPRGIDVYFENVGGKVWDAVFPLLNEFARVPLCGLIAQYNDEGEAVGPDRFPGIMRELLSKSITIRGFIQREFRKQRPEFLADMGTWIKSGQIKYREDIVEGLENAPEAFLRLFSGANLGKLVIKVS